jgi:hypothetical protein
MKSTLILVILCVCINLSAQTTPVPIPQIPRDVNALAALTAAISASGAPAPLDSVIQSNVQFANGDSATLTSKTLGRDFRLENLITTDSEQTTVRVAGEAQRRRTTAVDTETAELSASEDAGVFLLPLLISVVNNKDFALRFVGQEGNLLHIQFWNTYASVPSMMHLANFTKKDLWLDVASGLPSKLSFVRKDGDGAVPSVAVEFDFSNYQAVGAIKIPFTISRSLNGVLWGTIQVQSVRFNVGLSSTDFQLQ